MAATATEGQYTEEETPAPFSGFDPPAAPSYTSKIQGVADRLYGTNDEPGVVSRQADALRDKGDALSPLTDDFKKRQATPVSVRPPGDAPAIPPPPSKGLHAFMAPVDGESPLASLQKLIAVTGTFATGLGMGNRAAKASLAAINGAMLGWAEGDKERADRDVADWKNQTDAALASWETQSKAYERALTAKDLDLAQRLTSIKLTAAEHDNNVMVEAVEAQGLQGAIDTYGKLQQHADQLQLRRDTILQSLTQKDMDRDLRRELEASRQSAAKELAEMNDRSRRDASAERTAYQKERDGERAQDRKDKAAEGKILPAGEVEKLGDIRGFVEQLRDVRDAFDPSYTGPLKDWQKWAQSKSTGLPPQEENFRATLANFNNTLLKLRSGAAVTAQEYERIKQELPQTSDPPSKFAAKLATSIRMTETALETRRAEFSAAGYKVPDVKLRERDTPTIRVRRKSDGRQGTIEAVDFDPAKYDRAP